MSEVIKEMSNDAATRAKMTAWAVRLARARCERGQPAREAADSACRFVAGFWRQVIIGGVIDHLEGRD
jgi:hypothetical protein